MCCRRQCSQAWEDTLWFRTKPSIWSKSVILFVYTVTFGAVAEKNVAWYMRVQFTAYITYKLKMKIDVISNSYGWYILPEEVFAYFNSVEQNNSCSNVKCTTKSTAPRFFSHQLQCKKCDKIYAKRNWILVELMNIKWIMFIKLHSKCLVFLSIKKIREKKESRFLVLTARFTWHFVCHEDTPAHDVSSV